MIDHCITKHRPKGTKQNSIFCFKMASFLFVNKNLTFDITAAVLHRLQISFYFTLYFFFLFYRSKITFTHTKITQKSTKNNFFLLFSNVIASTKIFFLVSQLKKDISFFLAIIH